MAENLKTLDINQFPKATEIKDNDTLLIIRPSANGRVKPMRVDGNLVPKATDVATMKSEIETLRNKLSMLGDAYVGFARVSGDVDPAPSEEFIYGNRKLVQEIGSHMKLGTVKRVNNEAVLQHECAPGRITLASNGESMAVDGSEGDLLVYTDIPLYVIRNEATVNNVNMSCIGVGKVLSYWQGKESKKFEPFAVSPFYTVSAQLPSDERTCAHCIINDTISGSHIAVNGFVKEVYKANGNGYPNWAISAISTIQNAQKKNANASTNYPYMGLYYEFYELWIMMMYIECGTLDVFDLNRMGVGVTQQDKVTEATWNTENISGNSGIKYFNADGSVNGYAGIFDQTFKKGTDGTTQYNLQALLGGTYYVTTKCGEILSLLDGITKAGLVGQINSKHNIFYRDENNNVVHATDNSINLDTGDGMEVNKQYFLVRNVPNCQGLSDGVMTAVVNMYVKLTCADDLYKNDTSMTGGYIIFKLSHSVYRGFSLPLDGMFVQLSGAYYTSGKQDGKLIHKFYYAKKWQDIAPLTDTTQYTTIDNLDNLNILRGLTSVTVPGSSGKVKWVDYSKSLFCFKDWGGNIHQHETSYTWNGGYIWGGGTSDGLPEEGKACVKALAAGCAAAGSDASARSANCNYAASYGIGFFAGAFAVPQLKLKQ